ncbi:MAG: DUF881 domain-containing protein [Peptostreptococcaceae bacterium]|nr:DUF881 domain-containing protein [Peptostreptococcaceae bacterium]
MNRTNILIFLLCVMLGFGIIIQGKTTEGQMLYVSAKTITDYKTTIESEKIEIEKTNNLIKETGKEVTLYESSNTDSADLLVSNIEKERDLYGMFSGAVDLKGPGVIVTIDDGVRPLFEGENINNILVHDADILIVINDLKKNGAEAISVNGERMVETSSVICSGYTVEINGVRYARPFTIRAIGDENRMASSLIGPEGYGASLKNWGVLFEIELSDEIHIPAYTREKNYEYSEKVKEVEAL